MTSLSHILVARLLMRGTDRYGEPRGSLFLSTRGESEDLRAARDRARKRS